MGYLGDTWKALKHVVHDNASVKRDILADTTDLLVASSHQLPDMPGLEPSAEPDIYAIYAGAKNMGIADLTHMFVRLVGPDGKVLCDIHGIRHPVKDAAYLQAIIEPTDLEYFGSLKAYDDIPLWQGDAEAAGEKMRRAIEFVKAINESKEPYILWDQNCNTLFRSLLEIMGIDVPENLPGWTLGIDHELKEEIAAVEAMPKPSTGNGVWMTMFADALRTDRADVDVGFDQIRKSRAMSGAALAMA